MIKKLKQFGFKDGDHKGEYVRGKYLARYSPITDYVYMTIYRSPDRKYFDTATFKTSEQLESCLAGAFGGVLAK